MPACRDCGQTHEVFIDGVVCDVELYGSTTARDRLLKFCSPAVATDLVAQAEAQLASV